MSRDSAVEVRVAVSGNPEQELAEFVGLLAGQSVCLGDIRSDLSISVERSILQAVPVGESEEAVGLVVLLGHSLLLKQGGEGLLNLFLLENLMVIDVVAVVFQDVFLDLCALASVQLTVAVQVEAIEELSRKGRQLVDDGFFIPFNLTNVDGGRRGGQGGGKSSDFHGYRVV